MGGGTTIGTRIKADLIWASGLAALSAWRKQGRSALIGFDRVRPTPRGAFQPRKDVDIAPQRLNGLIIALKRWNVDIVSMDEACARLAESSARRFVSLSFNGSYRDVVTSAHPVLAQHGVPFTVYVPSAFPDGIAEPWWLALEAVIAQHDRISLVIDRKETHFVVGDGEAKMQLHTYLSEWLRRLPPSEFASAIGDLCTRYGVDMRAVNRDASITWDGIATLAADSRATIGSMTVNHPILANVDDETARRDIAMGRAVLETALQKPVRHFAFPFGDAASFRPQHVAMAREAGFSSAATAIPGVMGNTSPHIYRLPRLIWSNSLMVRDVRVRLAGY